MITTKDHYIRTLQYACAIRQAIAETRYNVLIDPEWRTIIMDGMVALLSDLQNELLEFEVAALHNQVDSGNQSVLDTQG